MTLARGVDDDHGRRRLLLDDALEHAAVGEREGIGPILGLHGPRGPIDALDDLLGRKALGDRGEFGADRAPLAGHLVARRAAGRGHAEHAGPAAGIALGPGVGEGLLDELRAVLERGRRQLTGRRGRADGEKAQPEPYASKPHRHFVRTKHR